MNPRSQYHRAAFSILVATLLAIAIFLPELMALGWHLVYGRTADFHGRRIPVPSGWFAIRRDDSLTLERMLHIPFGQPTPTIVFLSMHTRKGSRFDPNLWGNVQVHLQSRRGYRLDATREIQMIGAHGYCWEFVNRRDESDWWITCLVPAENLSADFSGRHSFAGALYSILPAITPAPGSI